MKILSKYLSAILMILAVVQTTSAQNYFRSVATGSWNSIATWESSPDNITWSAATVAPNYLNDLTITIQSPNTVTITGTTMTIDEVVINTGATLTNSLTGALTVNNGAGIDIAIYGTFIDNSTVSAVWLNATTTWLMGSNGTLIKTTGSASNPWQTHYNGGIATIPSTANWILRKTLAGAANDPALSTTTPGTGSVYPNLTIENNTASQWVTGASSSFTGNTIFPTVKGNLDIGGAGSNTVDFLNSQTNATPTRIIGNLTIRTGNVLRNNGTGIEIRGDLTVNGTLSYSGTSKVLFGGGNTQTIVATAGSIAVDSLEINKTSNDVTVNKSFTVDANVKFIQGRFFTSTANLITVGAIATATGYSNTSFISGPCIKLGTPGFTFPVGKGNNVQPIGMNAGAVGLTPAFWSENFAAPSGWTLNNILGAEGGFPNFFQITDDEGGVTPPGCGIAHNGNKTLHVTSVINPTGGAAYFASSVSATNRRAESPIINCTGKSSITLAFNYIGNGQGTFDNASLLYYDGTTWITLNSSLKSLICGSGQGQWTAYSIALPASANNNPSIKIGFQWVNNNDNTGTDPSFAVDDISLSAPVTESFSAEYFVGNPALLFGNNLEPTLDHISHCEYWDLTRLSGSTNRQVTLTWDNNSCGVTSMNNLRVARYDAGANIWRDHGNNIGLLTGTTAAGTITSSLISTVYCPYTLASIDITNPLPVSLLNFDVKAVNNKVLINWATATEPGNSFFTIEKSLNLKDINIVMQVAGKGNANTGGVYETNDYKPYTGNSYYRLKQTDVNGSSTYTAWKPVNFNHGIKQQLIIGATNGGIDFSISQCCENNAANVKILNTLGKVVFDKQLNLNTTNHLDLNNLAQGIYFLTVEVDGNVFKEKFQY